MPTSQPTNVVRLAIEVTRGALKMSDVHETLRKRVQRVLDSGAVSHMTSAPAPVGATRQLTGSPLRKARTS